MMYKGQMEEPLYSKTFSGQVSDGTNDLTTSFFQEYKYKLENLYDHFFTQKGAEIAQGRKSVAAAFHTSILQEVKSSYEHGMEELEKQLY